MINPPNIKDAPFSVLIETCPDLKVLRREHAARTAPERRRAADFTYSQAFASRLFRGCAPDAGGGDGIFETMAALAIDADFAPALLAVGSIEYQLGRHEEAMKHFLHLTELTRETADLAEIIDKTAQFLIDAGDLAQAECLFGAAVGAFPDVALYYSGLGYCAGKQGRKAEALAHAKQAVELEPDNAVHLCDHGWALIDAGRLGEAAAPLRRAIALAPGKTMAEKNLAYLERLIEKRLANNTTTA
jgi:tetratricopeptide (TPR) repeat protein